MRPAFAVVCCLFPATPLLAGTAEEVALARRFETDAKPFLQKYCTDCHGADYAEGELDVTALPGGADFNAGRGHWTKVHQFVRAHAMPPEDPKPSQTERDAFLQWVEDSLAAVDCTAGPTPGRVTMRRLNRSEYDNTVRDLLGVDLEAAADFPQDELAFGFDNNGDALGLPTILLEHYFSAAERIAVAAIKVAEPKVRHYPARRLKGDKGQDFEGDARIMVSDGAFGHREKLPPGEYEVRVQVGGHQAPGDPVRADVRVDGQRVRSLKIDAEAQQPQWLSVPFTVREEGRHKVELAFTNDFYGKVRGKQYDRNLILHALEIVGPIEPPADLPDSHRRLFAGIRTPDSRADAETFARRLASRAFRRPVADDEVERLVSLYDRGREAGMGFEAACRVVLQAVLVSPNFLYRVEPEPANRPGGLTEDLPQIQLASRLSYFLWSSTPDGRLLKLAEAGRLRENLSAEIDRMVADPRSRFLVRNFVGQWLELRKLDDVTPDPATYPDWDEDLRDAMRIETEMFVDHLIQNGRPLWDLLEARHTFVNERLARHYGIPGVTGDGFRRVELPADSPRGGLLTHGSVLTLTSNPTRTSPVKRGKWVLDAVLGTPPPPAPPDVPELEETAGEDESMSLREKLELHRSNAVCASCHKSMDPLGFGLENFDAVGAWRTADEGHAIDSTGVLPDGASFATPAQLQQVLSGRRDQIRRALAEKMLTYALGRGLEYYDRCAVDALCETTRSHGDTLAAMIHAVCESAAFTQRSTATALAGDRP